MSKPDATLEKKVVLDSFLHHFDYVDFARNIVAIGSRIREMETCWTLWTRVAFLSVRSRRLSHREQSYASSAFSQRNCVLRKKQCKCYDIGVQRRARGGKRKKLLSRRVLVHALLEKSLSVLLDAVDAFLRVHIDDWCS